jgi:hypothetical protein
MHAGDRARGGKVAPMTMGPWKTILTARLPDDLFVFLRTR